MLPADNRRYKSKSIENHLKPFTFKPRMSRLSKQLADQYYEKVVSRVHEAERASSAHSDEVQDECISISIPMSLANFKTGERSGSASKRAFDNKIKLIQYQQSQTEQRLQQIR